jgi:diguanylate cyclase (GGDEF)-like protein
MAGLEQRRVLLTAVPAVQLRLRDAFGAGLLRAWEPVPADSVERARFLLQHDLCDVLLIDESAYPKRDRDVLAWLTLQHRVPVVLLTAVEPEVLAQALEGGVQLWLPRELTLQHPGLLAAGLNHAAELGDLWSYARSADVELRECRSQINRLVGRLWDSTPFDSRVPWLTQRYLLERLQGEVNRAERHGTPFSVALGEVHPTADAGGTLPSELHAWTARRLTAAKRRCDLAGQYGPSGFMLLFVETEQSGAVDCCQRLRRLLEQPPGPGSIPIRASFGVAAFSPETATVKSLMSRAELQLEKAKARDAVVLSEPEA